jgi:serine/threonine protein kinase
MITADIVAVKIIDIDQSDTANPRNADSYSEFLKEIGALKILSENKARNINHVIDALPVGQSMWMITEFCGGGSVVTLVSILYKSLFRANCGIDETHGPRWPPRKVDYTYSSRGCRSYQMGA